MAEQIASAPTAESPGPRPKASHTDVHENLPFADRIFLAIENPVLRRELLTALRSNKAFSLHFFFLAALAFVVYRIWPDDAKLITSSDTLTRQIFHIFGESQLVLVSILAPAFSASAMTIEKERRCMDLLMTSPIRPGTILFGKYLSSVLYIFLLVVSTLPLVSIILWMPGLGPSDVLGLYMLLLSVAACFGMIGLTCSTFFHRSQSSLAITYMIVLPLALLLLVFAIEIDGFFLLESAAWPSAMLFVATILMYKSCHARLRRPFDPVFKAAEEEDVATQTGLVLVQDRFPDNLLAPPRSTELLPDGVNPIYQKEIRSEIFGRGTLFLRLIIQISMFLSVVFLTFLYLGKEYIFVDYLILFTMLISPAFACNTITQERERGTLDLLMTTLVKPSQIITGKFLACLRLSIFLTMCFYLFVGNDSSIVTRIAYLLVYLLIMLITIVFEISLAMFFSLVFRSTVQSMIGTYSVLLLLFATPVAAFQLLSSVRQMGREELMYVLFLSPFEAVYSVSPKLLGQSSTLMEKSNTIWPYFVVAYFFFSLLLLGYVFSAFERQCLENTKIR